MPSKENTKPQPQSRNKLPTSFRLSETALSLLTQLADDTGVSQTSVIEMALRDLAKARNLPLT